jgi:hypothetical protein
MTGGWYVYAIVAHGGQLPAGLTGFGEAELSLVASGGLAAVVGPLAPCGLQRTTEDVLRHGAVVEALQVCGPTLPVRFGTVLPDAEAVARALAEHRAELKADLARLGDKVEFGLTVLWDRRPGDDDPSHDAKEGEASEHAPGTRYLRARLAVLHRDEARREVARAIATELEAALGPLVFDRRCSVAPTERLAIRAAFLIEPTRFDACRQAIAEVRRRHPDLRVLVSGPWSPYSFVSRDPAGERGDPGRWTSDLSRRHMAPWTDIAHEERSAAPA